MTNKLFYGDNLEVLRGRDADGRPLLADESVDLIYLDPPFNSAANYNVLFRAPDGRAPESQIEAFEDTWHWTDAAALAFQEVVTGRHQGASALLRAMRVALGENDLMAYLAMMAVRLTELHRVLKPTGSLYLHCDPTASHCLKLLLDGIFGPAQFKNEIIWKRTSSANNPRRWGPTHDVVFFYSKTSDFRWNRITTAYSAKHVAQKYANSDEGGPFTDSDLTGAGTRRGSSGAPWRDHDPTSIGRHWAVPRELWSGLGIAPSASSQAKLDALDAASMIHWPISEDGKPGLPRFKRHLSSGVPIQDVIDDIPPINSQARERLGYPTQKPVALLERIIAASSHPGDVVLDPFCGCGTSVHASQRLGRSWIGIDITHLAISLIERRLKDAFPDRMEGTRAIKGVEFDVHGVPRHIDEARDLAARDKHQFQWWAVSLVDAVPQGGKKKGADRGIDGIRWVKTGPRPEDLGRIIVSVKGGENLSVRDVRDLAGTVEREKALGGLLITLGRPTREMLRDAASHGFATAGLGEFRKIMIKPIDELLNNVHDPAETLPPLGRQEGFRRAARETSAKGPTQSGLDV